MRTIAAAALILAAGPAWGHDFWINNNGYKSPTGVHCCGPSDCHIVPAEQIRMTPTGFALPNGEVVPFADALVSEDQNYWRCRTWDDHTRCFFYPAPGS